MSAMWCWPHELKHPLILTLRSERCAIPLMPLANFFCRWAARPRDEVIPSLHESVPGHATTSLSRPAPASSEADRLEPPVKVRQVGVRDPLQQEVLVDRGPQRVADVVSREFSQLPGLYRGDVAEGQENIDHRIAVLPLRVHVAVEPLDQRWIRIVRNRQLRRGLQRLVYELAERSFQFAVPAGVLRQARALLFDEAPEFVDTLLGNEELHPGLGAVLLLAKLREHPGDCLR